MNNSPFSRAYDQHCTHLLYPVLFNNNYESFYYPFHHGSFNAMDGSVQYGPPKTPLPQYTIEVNNGKIWISTQES